MSSPPVEPPAEDRRSDIAPSALSSDGKTPNFECLQWPVSLALGVRGLFPVELQIFGSEMRSGPDASHAPAHRQSWRRAIGILNSLPRLPAWREQDGWTYSLSALLAFAMQWPDDLPTREAALHAFLDHCHEGGRLLFPAPKQEVEVSIAPGVYCLGSEYWYEGAPLTFEQAAGAHWVRFDQFQRWLDALGETRSEHVRAWITACGAEGEAEQTTASIKAAVAVQPPAEDHRKQTVQDWLEMHYEAMKSDVGHPTATKVATWLVKRYGNSESEHSDWVRSSSFVNGGVPEKAILTIQWVGEKDARQQSVASFKGMLSRIRKKRGE